jgi:plasmid stabilization system protein ParE
MSGFALHPEAYDDIDEIRTYIAEDSPDAADRRVNEIFDRLRQLARFPGQGFRRPNYTSLPLRFIAVRDYLIVYAPETDPLWVLAVIHGRRNPRVITAILKGRE